MRTSVGSELVGAMPCIARETERPRTPGDAWRRPYNHRARFKRILAAVLASLALLFQYSGVPCYAVGGNDVSATVEAPELDGGIGWLNTDKPIKLKDLRGKIVLLDFWTFCCINCMHILPDLHRLETKYPQELVIIGVHSAKFDNEKSDDTIRKAILRYDIEHPVVNDANFKIWQAYKASAWPTLVLIDPDGHIVTTVSGEGRFAFLDETIDKLIEEFDKQGKINRRPVNFVLEKSKTPAGKDGTSGKAISTVALSFPGKVTTDDTGQRLFISDSGHNRIIIANTHGDLQGIVGQSGAIGAADGSFDQATFHHPQGLAYSNNKLYVADTENHLIRLIDLNTRKVSTIAGVGHQAPFRSGGGKGLKTALNSPWDLVIVKGYLYIAMAGAHQIWRMNLERGSLEPFAGDGRENIVDGPTDDASLAQPSGITSDGKVLYFADSEVSAVRKTDLASDGRVSTIIGKGLFEFGDKDGNKEQARLQHPLGILWHDGKLYVADSYNHKIKIVDPVAKTVTTLLGTGKPGYVDGKEPQFSEPAGLAASGQNLFVADTNNNKIRVVNLNDKSVSTLQLQQQALQRLINGH